MEMSNISATLWVAAQTVTAQHVAWVAVISLAAAAAMFVYVSHISPHIPHMREALALRFFGDGNNSAPPEAPQPVLGRQGDRVRRNLSPELESEAVHGIEGNEFVIDIDALASQAGGFQDRFNQVSGLANNDPKRVELARELCGWLEASMGVESDTDLAKLIGTISDLLKALLADSSVETLLEALKIDRLQDGRDLLRVQGDGNCAYYSIASALIILKLVPEGLPHNFIELSEALRRCAAQEVKSRVEGEQLDDNQGFFLDLQVQGAINAWLKKLLNEALFQPEALDHVIEEAAQALGESRGNSPRAERLRALLEPITKDPEEGFSHVTGGFSDEEIEGFIGEDQRFFRGWYADQIGNAGFFASLFELSILSEVLRFPLFIENARDSCLNVAYNVEGLPADAPRVVIRSNEANDHFDMVMPA